jgi:hypothetical protein
VGGGCFEVGVFLSYISLMMVKVSQSNVFTLSSVRRLGRKIETYQLITDDI